MFQKASSLSHSALTTAPSRHHTVTQSFLQGKGMGYGEESDSFLCTFAGTLCNVSAEETGAYISGVDFCAHQFLTRGHQSQPETLFLTWGNNVHPCSQGYIISTMPWPLSKSDPQSLPSSLFSLPPLLLLPFFTGVQLLGSPCKFL